MDIGFKNSFFTKIEDIIGGLTLREKIGQTVQLLLSDIDFSSEEILSDFLHKYPLGSVFGGTDVINMFRSKVELPDAVAQCNSLLKIPLAVAGDLENGAGFPSMLALGAARDLGLAYEYGRWTAINGRRKGFTWAFAPVADIALNWMNPALAQRCLGDDPELVMTLVAEIVRGMQDYHLSAAVKHFPGDGVDFRDQHLSMSVNSLSRERWMATFGKVYRSVFAAGADSIMSGHIALPFIDPPGANGIPRPATLSAKICRDFLRDELKFTGVVVSDALIMSGFVMHKPYAKRIVDTFLAGTDVLLWPELDYFDLMEKAILDGIVPEKYLDDAVRRILVMKAKQGVLGGVKTAKLPDPIPQIGNRKPDPVVIADEIAERGAVLVRNRKNLLPLNSVSTKKVLLWLAACNTKTTEAQYASLRQKLEARGAEVVWACNGNCLDLHKREQAGERYDAVIFIFNQGMHDIKNTIRPVGDAAECLWTLNYTEHHSPIVVSLKSPYLLWENPALDTLVNMNSDGAAVLRALPKLLYGEIPFTGTSPVSLEVSLGIKV